MLNFEDFKEQFRTDFNNLIDAFLESEKIENKLNLKVFTDSADYIQYAKQNTSDVLVMCLNKGITRSDSDNVKTYLQDMELQFLVSEDNLKDFSKVLNAYQDLYNQKPLSISNSAVVVKMGESHGGWTKKEFGRYDYDYLSFNIKWICYDTYYMFNDYLIYIDYVPIFATNWTDNRTYELQTDGKKRSESKFFYNSSGYVLSLAGALYNNSAMRTIEKQIHHQDIANYYNVYICYKDYAHTDSDGNLDIIEYDESGTPIGYKTTGDEDVCGLYVLKSGTTDHKYGSIGAYNIQLYPAEKPKF